MASTFQIVDRVLPTLVDAPLQDEGDFHWREALAFVGGLKSSSGVFTSVSARDFMGDVASQATTAPLARLPELSITGPSATSYTTAKYGKFVAISEEDIKDPNDGLPVVGHAQTAIRRATWLDLERAVSDLTVSSNSGFTITALGALGGVSTGTAWNAAGGLPTNDIEQIFSLVRAASNGMKPDTIHMTYDVAQALTLNADMRGYLDVPLTSVTGSGLAGERKMTFPRLQRVLNDMYFDGKGKVVIFEAVYDSANKGQTQSNAEVGTSGYFWMGRTRNDNAVVTSSGIKLNPVAAAVFMFEDWKMGTEELSQERGAEVWGKIRAGVQVCNADLGLTVSGCLI